ncbi:MAG TPA: flagellar hook-associated protein FlgK [Terriglobales bacterium]|jgi:flagellar hook-associated protein 1 FlgK
MGSLNTSLAIAVGALTADQGALNATANNVANASTPGYSRQVPVFAENTPLVVGSLTFGNGVSLQQLQSIRDPILQIRIAQETQDQGQLGSFVSSMQQVQVLFNNTSGSDIGSQLSNFFGSLNQLSADPTDLSLRQGVLTAAGNVANSFNNTANNLAQQRSNLDLDVTQDVRQVNTLTGQIAQLNGQISNLQNIGADASVFVDQRDQLIGQLSSLIDVSQIQSDNGGLTLTTSNGAALVAGEQSFTLTTQPDASGLQHIFAQGKDITSTITSGQIAGVLQVRDQKIPAVLSSLDTLASGLSTALNTANEAGFDLNGNAGTALFSAPPASGTGAASSMSVVLTDPSLVAASSDGSAGSNGNLATLSAVNDQPIVSGQTPTQFYSNIVFSVGSDVANGTANQNASQLVLQQLQDQRGSISGVSLDEEASHLILYQQAYDAAAHVVTAINQMMEEAVNLGSD